MKNSSRLVMGSIVLLGSLAVPVAPSTSVLGQDGLRGTPQPSDSDSDSETGVLGTGGVADPFATARSSSSAVRLGASSLVGRGITRPAIRRVLTANLGRVRICHEAAIARRADFAGNLTVRFVIRAGGRVVSTDVDDLRGDPYVGACVGQALRRITFPGPREGEIRVTQVFELALPRPAR